MLNGVSARAGLLRLDSYTSYGESVRASKRRLLEFLITAKDLNDAVQVASRIPGARHGTVEVRPIMEFDKP